MTERPDGKLLLKNRYSVRIFHFLHHENAVEIANAFYITEFRAHEFLIRFHVARVDFQREVVFAAGVVALGNFVNVLDGFHEVIHQELRVMPEPHMAKHRYANARFLGVEYGMVALDESFALQSLLSVEGRRSGKVDSRGKFLDREGGIFLKDAQDFAVDVVEFFVSHVLPNKILKNSFMSLQI